MNSAQVMLLPGYSSRPCSTDASPDPRSTVGGYLPAILQLAFAGGKSHSRGTHQQAECQQYAKGSFEPIVDDFLPSWDASTFIHARIIRKLAVPA